MVFNHEVPFLGIYSAASTEQRPLAWLISGDIIIPRVASDPRIEGHLAYATTKSFGTMQRSRISVHCVNASGAQDEYDNLDDLEHHAEFDYFNQPRADDTYDADALKIVKTTNDKGYIDKDISANMGWRFRLSGRLFESPHGLHIRADPYFTMPWSLNAPPPSAGWPLVATQKVGMAP
jgi:hypothetical protein